MDDNARREQQLANEQFLRNNEQFKDMPDRIQSLILQSPHACADFKSFFANGGRVDVDENEPLAFYRHEPEPRIVIGAVLDKHFI